MTRTGPRRVWAELTWCVLGFRRSGSIRLLPLANMFGADLGCREKAEKRNAVRSTFDSGAAVGFFALDNADHGSDDHAGFASSFDGGDGGSAGGAHIVDDDDVGALAAESLDAPASAVSFLSFADEKSVQWWSGGVGQCTPGAGGGDIGDDGVCAHGEPAHGFSSNALIFKQLEDGVAGEPSAFCVEGGGAAVNVVVARSARRERELAKAEAQAGKQSEELLGVGWHQ